MLFEMSAKQGYESGNTPHSTTGFEPLAPVTTDERLLAMSLARRS